MKILSKSEVSRDQGASTIGAILMRLCDASDALGAALVDAEGETVDYAGRVSPYDLRVAAAEWRLVQAVIESCPVPAWRPLHELLVRASGRSFAVRAMTDGYALVLVLPRHGLAVSERALAEAGDELERETGLRPLGLPQGTRWLRVEVRTAAGDGRRPERVWVDGAWRPLSILGRVPEGLGRREVGYMARLDTGAELLLIREPLGRWFAGEPA
jgi:hypothetical protein